MSRSSRRSCSSESDPRCRCSRGHAARRLTAQGASLLPDVRRVVQDTDLLKARARSLAGGLEAELSIVIDVMFPQPLLMLALRDFKRQFPATPLRLYIEALGAVSQRVLDGECSLGVTGTLPFPPPTLTAEPLLSEQLVTVVAPDSPLAAAGTPVPLHWLIGETQLVLTDRSRLTDGTDDGVQGRTSGSWRTCPPSTRSCTRGSAGSICHAGWWLTILRRVAWCRSCWRGRPPA